MNRMLHVLRLLLTAALLLAACTAPVAPAAESGAAPAEDVPAGETESESSETIKIGFMGPLTGGAAFIGTEQVGFAKVTVDAFNERTGLNVEIVEGDTEINADIGRVVAERFVADPEIIGVIGPAGSQVCQSTQPIFEEAGLVQITPSCTRTDLTDPGAPTFFRPIPADVDQSQTDASYLVNELGAQSVFLLDDQSSYSVGLNDEMEALLIQMGITDIERASVSQEETDFSSTVTAILQDDPDAVFFPSQIESQEGTLAVQLAEQNYDGIYFLADGGFSLGWVGTAGEAANGTYVSFFAPDPNFVPEAAPYNERYAAEYSEEFGAFGGASMHTTYVLLDAVERCANADDLTRECMVTAVAETDIEQTPLGIPVRFQENGQIEGGNFFIFQVQDGQFQLLQ